MDLQAALTAARESGAAVIKVLDDLKQHNTELAQELQAACDAYFDDVVQRKTRMEQKVTELVQQRERIDEKIKALQPSLVDATASGDTETFNHIQQTLADFESEKAAASTQIELLSSAAISGDTALLAACAEKQAALDADNERLAEVESLIRRLSGDQKNLWTNLHDTLVSVWHFAGHRVRSYEKVQEHFHNPRTLQGQEQQQVVPKAEEPPVRNLRTAVYKCGNM